MNSPTIFILSAPSGAGKTSLAKALVEQRQDIAITVSHTTREKRPAEIAGHHYHFVSRQTFKTMIAANAFVEHAEVFGNYYGTSLQSIDTVIASGKHALLDIDWQGARIVREQYPETTTSIFIVPPSLNALKERLIARGQDDTETIAKRMQAAKNELSHQNEYDFVVTNDDFATALGKIIAIINGSL